MPASVLLLASREYLNVRAIVTVVSTLPLDTVIQLTSSRTGIGRSVLASGVSTNRPIEAVRWQPTRPHQPCTATRAIVFWDETADDALLRSLVVLKRARIPIEIYDTDGNVLDLSEFCARLTHNGANMTSPATMTPPRPPTIVDAPATAPGENAKRATNVRLQLSVPESTVEQYELQARAAGVSLEKVCADRLRTAVTHTAGRGLYFTDAERSELERVTGGYTISDADTALTRIKATVTLKIGDLTVEVTGKVLARCASRASSMRKTLEQYVRQEVIQGLERSCGLRPW
jgi:hypothetical protein